MGHVEQVDNDVLIELIKHSYSYQTYKSPCFDRVLEVMAKVYRRLFLDDVGIHLFGVDFEAMREMFTINEEVKVNPTNSSDQKIGELIEAVEVALDSGKHWYVNVRDLAYNDAILPIGHGQTCSQPSVVAFMAHLLELADGMKVFEIGTGCGYSAAVTLHLIGNGRLITAEIIPELAEKGQRNLEAHFGKKTLEQRLSVIAGDGSIGLQEEAPFDRIYLTAGVDLKSFDPSKLAQQLNPNGGLLLFSEKDGDLIKHRYEGGILKEEKRYPDFHFVPLKGQNS